MIVRLFLAVALIMPLLGFGQGFNGNFENLQPNGIPTGWSIASGGGSATSTEAHLGKRAAKAWVYDNYRAGTWTSNTPGAEGNASELSGYYQYVGDKNECDKALVTYLLGSKAVDGGIDTLAWGETELKLSKDYKEFDLSIAAKGSGVPEFMSIQFKPAGHCNMHGAATCCFLYVDDIILSGTTTISTPIIEEQPTEAPAENVEESEEGTKKEETPTEQPAEIEEKPEPDQGVAPKESIEEEAAEELRRIQEERDREQAAPEETPVEEESTEPTEEGWDKGEESSDDGIRK